MGINPKCENAIAFQIKMDFPTIRESDSPWKLDTDGEVLQIYIEANGKTAVLQVTKSI